MSILYIYTTTASHPNSVQLLSGLESFLVYLIKCKPCRKKITSNQLPHESASCTAVHVLIKQIPVSTENSTNFPACLALARRMRLLMDSDADYYRNRVSFEYGLQHSITIHKHTTTLNIHYSHAISTRHTILRTVSKHIIINPTECEPTGR